MAKPPNKKYCECPNCGRVGTHYWHHVFNKSDKRLSEKYNAIVYWCDFCHIWDTYSIHNNAKLRLKLKQEHQQRIMLEEPMTMTEWIDVFGENYL